MTEQSSKSILLVEDDLVFLKRLGLAMRERNFITHEASTTNDAVAIAKEYQPKYAVLDLNLPGSSGLDALEEIVKVVPGIRAILLTGYGSITTTVKALRIGAVDYLTKPVDADTIITALAGIGGPKDSRHPADIPSPSLSQVEWDHIQRIVHDCDGNLSKAAKKLGLHRRSLQRKLAKRPSNLQ